MASGVFLSLVMFHCVCVCRDSEWTRIQTTAAKKTLVLGQLKIATHNLFLLMYKHLQKKIPPHEHEDTLRQLDKVSLSSPSIIHISHTHTHTTHSCRCS